LNPAAKLISRGLLITSLLLGVSASAQTAQTQCHWWQFRCDDSKQIEGLPAEAPRTGTVITVDTATNRLYLFRDGQLVDQSLAATGSEKILKKGSKVWLFHTPQGHLKVLRKIEDPVWTKPDWAFVEAGEPVPPPDSPLRKVKGHLGKYALDLGDGIMIHGTDQYDSIGHKVSHGCIRLPEDMLERVYNETPIGADVFIFESQVPQTAGKTERHSDLD
jgi:lipoprotein-anchoring transpeptidase ErfK/SrfK